MPRKFLITSIILALVFTGTGAVFALNGYFSSDSGNVGGDSADTTRGLAGHWKFNEGSGSIAKDSSNSENDGTLAHMATSTAWTKGPSGKYGSALDFDGTDDYVNVADDPSLDFTDGEDFTLTGWFRWDNRASEGVLIAKRNSTSTAADAGYIVYVDEADGLLYAEVSDGTDTFRLASTSTVVTAAWTHFAVVWDDDSSTNTALYTNASLDDGGKTGPHELVHSFANSDPLRIGSESDGENHFQGAIDEIRIYKRALSAAEIREIYASGAPLVHLKLDEGGGSRASDASGNDNDGTLQGDWATSSAWVAGKHGTALRFDGSDDYVSIPDSQLR